MIFASATGVFPLDPQFGSNGWSSSSPGRPLYFIYLFAFAGLNREEKKRVGVIIILFAFSIVFWAAFEQAPTSLNLFARDFTERTLRVSMPASWLQSVNSLFVLLAPVFAGSGSGSGARVRRVRPGQVVLGRSRSQPVSG